MSQGELEEVYRKILESLKELKKEDKTDTDRHPCQFSESYIYTFDHGNSFEGCLNNHYKLICENKHDYMKHPDENEKLGAKLILEIFEIFRNSHLNIIQKLISENLKLKNDLRISHNFISNLERKTNILIDSLSNSSMKEEYYQEGKVRQHPSRENCLDSHENLEEKVMLF
jgi:hypothetical protein